MRTRKRRRKQELSFERMRENNTTRDDTNQNDNTIYTCCHLLPPEELPTCLQSRVISNTYYHYHLEQEKHKQLNLTYLNNYAHCNLNANNDFTTSTTTTTTNVQPEKEPHMFRHTKRRKRCPTTFLPPVYLNFLYIYLFYIILSSEIVNCQRLFKQPQQSPAFPLPINYPNLLQQQQQQQPQQQSNPFASVPQRTPAADFISQQGGVIKDRNITLTKQNNPIIIKRDIIIRRDAKLTIESGCELLFDKKRGIIVYGTLEILGQANDKVKLNLLKSPQSATINLRSQNSNNNNNNYQTHLQQQVRLVDGDLPSEGRVQIKFNDKWQSLCTNSKNLTAADIKVLCRQVGYQEGAWYKWFPKRNETTFQVMSKSFYCTGQEQTIGQCKRWNRLRSGGGVCDYHSDLGIRCSKKIVFQQDDLGNSKSVPIYDYWRGIEFVQSESQQEYILDGQMKQKVSRSKLSHVFISEAGLDDVGNATAAIRVLGQPPRLNDIEIKNSVYGIMIEEADDAIRMDNIRLTNNLGFPLFVNTSWGKVSLDGMHVENNGGDGIRIVRHEKTLIGSHDFCKFANLGTSQSYPVVLSHEQQFLTSGNDCCQEFISQNQLTVHFPVLRSTHNNLLPESDNNRRISVPPGVQLGRDAHLIIYDDYRDEFPFKLRIQNGTRAQSIVSKSGRLKICYEPASYRTVLFTIELVADVNEDEDGDGRRTGIARDVEISNSYIRRNEGRGIWVDNQRSGVRIINTTVIQHNYLSGVHVENGTGEVIVESSYISNNTGHGLYINLAGGYYHIDNSTISGNSLSGIMIEYDKRPELIAFNHTMHLGYSLLANNGESGLFMGNVCRSDAYWNISMNSFIKNKEDAVVFESCQPTQDNVLRFNQLTSRLNLMTITTNDHEQVTSSGYNQRYSNSYQELFITHNVFLENARRAIKLAPVFFVKSFIRHNLFKDHPLAVLYINNQALEGVVNQGILNNNTALAPVSIRIASNRFYTNGGRYVANIGLQEDSPKQTLMFTKNYLEDNYITEPYADLRPRSRVSAVVVVSSSNARVVRNRFDNPRSSFEMGTHLEMHAKIINATANFWGGHQLDAGAIYRRIFDRKNRYNLAQIEFLQYLLSPEDLEYITDLSFDRERDKITTFKNGTRLGGEVKGFEELPADTYLVYDDIFIRPGGHLILKSGTTFKFHDGVGMMVQGRLDALGRPSSPIQFTSLVPSSRIPQRAPITTTTTVAPNANPWVSHQPVVESGNLNDDYELLAKNVSTSTARHRYVRDTMSSNNVRLSHTTMGRLEVQIDGIWGPVCDYNFDIQDAAVVCQQLGMIVNKDDWLLERYQYASDERQHELSLMSTDALMTNLRCDPTLDTDVTACKAEISSRGDFDSVCNSEVGIRCFPPSWSGLRLGMGAEVSTIEHVIIQRAGMFDYASFALRPALQVDFNRHWLNSLVVKSNSDSGVGIMFNDVIGRHHNELGIIDSKFLNNERHGIELRSRGLTIRGCTMNNNRQNGLDYNPVLSERELADLLSWLQTAKNSDSVVPISFPSFSDTRRNSSSSGGVQHFSVPSSEESFRFYVIAKNPQPDLRQTFTIGTDPGHMLSAMLINPIHPESTEVLNMSLGLNPESPIWDLRINTTSLPMVSPGYKFHFNYTSGSRPVGNIVLYIRSRYNNRDLKVLTKFIPPHLVMSKFDQTAANINSKLINTLVIANCSIMKNGIGLKFRHPNYPHGPGLVYNRRYSNETTNITGSLFDGNYFSSIFVGSDEFDSGVQDEFTTQKQLDIPTSEIRYNVLGNKFYRNKDGVRQFSRDIRYSFNVFHWTINDTQFDQNKGGGINLVLPYFWKYDTNMSHTIELSNNSFMRNSNFELAVDGHFAMVNLTGNTFKLNRCRNRLIGFTGMEKRLLFRYNLIEQNICNRLIDFNIQSHADKMGSVPTAFEFNALRSNRRLISNSTYASLASNFRFPKLLTKLHPLATDYALALRGVQALNISRNVFSNPELRFELVVAIIMDPDERTVNAVENYWGYVIPGDISERIFDFDDWNSYASVELSPFLIRDSFYAATMIAAESSEFMNNAKRSLPATLGGRLMRSMVLPYRKEPYIIESDFTVMPNVRLTIERGVTLEFMPNVGILVLGDLIATGTREKPIQMRPLLSAHDVIPLRNYLFPTKTRPNLTQVAQGSGEGGPSSYEQNHAFRHYQFSYSIDLGSVRLCKNEICNDGAHIYENNVEEPQLRKEVLESDAQTAGGWKMDGFLEIFNMTTLQWVPVCDPLFTEHTARVVCRQLGYSHLSLFKRGRRYTIEQEQVTSVRHWPESVQCEGDESNLSSCPLAATGFMNHSTSCQRESNQFVYVYCRDFPESPIIQQHQQHHNQSISNEHLHHWGGIRFSCPSRSSINEFGQVVDSSSGRSSQASSGFNQARSRLQYVTIDRAGFLHRKRAPALQVLQCNVHLEYVALTNSAHHGLELITSSSANQNLHQLRVRNNLGVGINYLSLTGSSSAARLVPYLPLKHLDLSSDIFGLVDVCGANKEIRIEERILLFFRYNSRPVDCVKIITSKLSVKHLGLRMLQFDLFNSSSLSSRPDHVRIYDGNVFDRDSRLLVELGVEEKHRQERPELKFYQSSDSTMTVRLHASGAGPYQGFVAEVVTTPISYNTHRDIYNNITFSDLSDNKLGALIVSSAGESTANLIIKNNRFESNCLHLFGNFTSCSSPIYMELQNCQKLRLVNNLIKNNQGGLMIKSYSHSAVAALEASIENNVFETNHNTYTMALLGPKTDPYQKVNVIDNYITRNVAQYLSNIVLSRIVANFSNNIISGNVGKHQIEVVGFDKLPLSYQTFYNNWIYNNSATFERDQSTISGNSAGQQYYMNYFVNPDNHFEISTKNWSRYDVRPLQVPRDDEIIHLVSGDGSTKDVARKTADSIPLSIIEAKRLDLYQATINAKHNWWGFNSSSAIQGRIRDRVQHEELIKVDFTPHLETNRTILSGICSGGWQRVNGACLVYIATRMSYAEARDFCDRERATIPLLRGNHYEFIDFIQSQDFDFDPKVERIWVRSFEVSRDACPAINDWRTKNYDCNERNGFLCEKDPQVIVSLAHWHRETGGLVALILALITIILTCCCSLGWFYKSRHRQREKIERKNSLYASMRSIRGAGSYASNNSLGELFLHRQLYSGGGGAASNNHDGAASGEKSSITDLSLSSTQWTQPSNDDETNLVRLDPTGNSGDSWGRTKKKRKQQQQQATYTARPAAIIDDRHHLHFNSEQAAYNPTYLSPHTPPVAQRQAVVHDDYFSNTPTPAPSLKEPHPKALLSNSRTPSYNGSLNGGGQQQLMLNPMPNGETYEHYRVPPPRESYNVVERQQQQQQYRQRPPTRQQLRTFMTPDDELNDEHFDELPPPPQLLYTHYGGIGSNNSINNLRNTDSNKRFEFDHNNSTSKISTGVDDQANVIYTHENLANSAQERRLIGDFERSSSSSINQNNNMNVNMNNLLNQQIESFEEESTNSYLETYKFYNDTYKSALQPINGDQISLVLTEQSSITDLITTTRTIDRQMDEFISMNPQGVIVHEDDNGLAYQPQAQHTGYPNPPPPTQSVFHSSHSSGNLSEQNNSSTYHTRAASDVGSARSARSNLMETSFDDFTNAHQAAMYAGGSGRLSAGSPASSFAHTDSKLGGSRVYLETSFE